MNDETIKMLEALAVKMGTTAEYLWEVLVTQAVIGGWINIACCLAVLAIVCVLDIIVLKKRDDLLYDDKIMVTTFAWALTAVALAFCLVKISFAVNAIANPEYWALKQVMEMVR